jgi:hypothetical protein
MDSDEPVVREAEEPYLPEPRRKRQWSDFSSGAQKAIIVGAIAELIMTTLALRDLARRPSREVRGWKPMWVLLFFVQPFGPLLYFVGGRRRSAE